MTTQQTTAIPEVKDTIIMLRRLSADEKIRQEAYYREKRLHDEATELGTAVREGIAKDHAKLAQRWREMGMTEAEIKRLLGE